MSDSSEPRPTPVSERRLGLRRTLVIRQVRIEEEREVFFGYATSLGAGGLFIQTMTPRAPGMRVRIRFDIPGEDLAIECTAEVAWRREFHADTCRNPGMGLRFLDLPADAAKRIEEFVAREPPEASAGLAAP